MSRTEIRKAILNLKQPFCTADLFSILEKTNPNVDRDIILDVLDELYEARLVEYKRVRDELWAFYVA